MADRGQQRSKALREVGVAVWTSSWLLWGCREPCGAGWPQPPPPPSLPPECRPKVACFHLLPPQVFDMFDKDGKPACFPRLSCCSSTSFVPADGVPCLPVFTPAGSPTTVCQNVQAAARLMCTSCVLCCVRWDSSPPPLSWRSSCSAWTPTRCGAAVGAGLLLTGALAWHAAEPHASAPLHAARSCCPLACVAHAMAQCRTSCLCASTHTALPPTLPPRHHAQDGSICFEEFEAAMTGQAEDEETERQLREIRVRRASIRQAC